MKKKMGLLSTALLVGSACFAQVAVREPVLNGIDVLEQQHFSVLQQLAAKHEGHLRLALMTNQNGLDNKGGARWTCLSPMLRRQCRD